MARRTTIHPIAAGLAAAAATLAAVPALPGHGAEPESEPARTVRVSLEEGRRLVRMMDDIYKAAVITTHKMYVHDPGTPAAVIWAKQVLNEMNRKGWPKARIFEATGRPLNPENSVADPFEEQAIAAFKKGKPAFEKVSPGELRYATEIRIVDRSCLVCHVKNKEGDLVGGVSYRISLTAGRR